MLLSCSPDPHVPGNTTAAVSTFWFVLGVSLLDVLMLDQLTWGVTSCEGATNDDGTVQTKWWCDDDQGETKLLKGIREVPT